MSIYSDKAKETLDLLRANSEWIDRYKKYAYEINSNIIALKEKKASFHKWNPLHVYLTTSEMKKSGNISFSLYLLHYYPVMLLDRKVFDFSTCTPYALLGVFVSIIICILLGYGCWYLVEYRFTKWLRRTK